MLSNLEQRQSGLGRLILPIVLVVFILLFPTISQAETRLCSSLEVGWVEGVNYTPSGKSVFVYKREFDLLTEMSRNSGELGEKTENLEEYYMEFLARLEISRYLQQEINLTFSSSGENSSVIKIDYF